MQDYVLNKVKFDYADTNEAFPSIDPGVEPFGSRVIVQIRSAKTKTAGGIILPDTAKEKPKQGKVISLGDGKLLDDGKRAAFQVKAGDRVLFSSYAGNEVTVDGKEYLVMTEDDVLAVVD